MGDDTYRVTPDEDQLGETWEAAYDRLAEQLHCLDEGLKKHGWSVKEARRSFGEREADLERDLVTAGELCAARDRRIYGLLDTEQGLTARFAKMERDRDGYAARVEELLAAARIPSDVEHADAVVRVKLLTDVYEQVEGIKVELVNVNEVYSSMAETLGLHSTSGVSAIQQALSELASRSTGTPALGYSRPKVMRALRSLRELLGRSLAYERVVPTAELGIVCSALDTFLKAES